MHTLTLAIGRKKKRICITLLALLWLKLVSTASNEFSHVTTLPR